MKSALVGHTGFVGGNLLRQHAFGACFNSRNIQDMRGGDYDLVVCAGVSAVKWWANQHPEEDLEKIQLLLDVLETVQARRCVLISTVDVYPAISGVDESFDCHAHDNHAYGKHRLLVEDRLAARFDELSILRLSGLFGPGLKKNVIYDLLHDNCLEMINPESSFQRYNLDNLRQDIKRVRAAGLRVVNLVNQPLPTSAIIERYFPAKTVGGKHGPSVQYDLRSRYAEKLGGQGGYLLDRQTVLDEIGRFVESERARA
jgi:nucleoside-diphosphate-sugar epimerase